MKKFLLTIILTILVSVSFSQNYTHYLNSAYADDQKETKEFYYDENYRMIADYWEDLRENGLTLRDSLEYDANGNVTRLSCHQWYDNSYWLYANYIDYEYNELNQRITRRNYNNFGGTFELGGTYNYTYDENGNQVYYEMIFGSFGLFEKCERTFDENNNCIQELGYQTDYAGGFTPSWKIDYTYNSDGFLTEMWSYYYQGGWALNTYIIYTRDENNNITIEECFTPSGAVGQRHEYEYDMNILCENVAPFVNPEGQWPNPQKTVNAIVKDKFWTQDMYGTLQYVCDYYFYYREISDNVEENAAENVSLYPTPTNSILTIEANDYQNVTIYDIAGRCVFESEINNVLNIDTKPFSKGMYIVKMSNKNAVLTKKIIVE